MQSTRLIFYLFISKLFDFPMKFFFAIEAIVSRRTIKPSIQKQRYGYHNRTDRINEHINTNFIKCGNTIDKLVLCLTRGTPNRNRRLGLQITSSSRTIDRDCRLPKTIIKFYDRNDSLKGVVQTFKTGLKPSIVSPVLPRC